MKSLPVCDIEGRPAGTFDIDDGLLVLKKGNQAVHDAVVAHMAAMRRGTASVLNKASVAGSNKKPWRQKGTGRARAGLRQSPVWRGGGVAFGPHPRDFSKAIPRKVARLAFRHALSEKLAAGQVMVLKELKLAEPKTKAFAAMMKTLKIEAPVIFIVDKLDRALILASRNIPGVELAPANSVHTYQLVRYPTVVASMAAMEALRNRLKGGVESAA